MMRHGIARRHEPRETVRSVFLFLLLVGVMTMTVVCVVSYEDGQDAQSMLAVESVVSSRKSSS
jgi:hypothetical protein